LTSSRSRGCQSAKLQPPGPREPALEKSEPGIALEPLAEIIFKQQETDPSGRAEEFLNDQVADAEEALAGACDIIAEWINEDENARKKLRYLFEKEAVIYSAFLRFHDET
jgi:transcriptional accessory protein Tex/SPT6